MFTVKLLENSLRATVTLLWTCLNTFSHVFTSPVPLEVLYYTWSLLRAVSVLTSHIKSFYVYAQFQRANQTKN